MHGLDTGKEGNHLFYSGHVIARCQLSDAHALMHLNIIWMIQQSADPKLDSHKQLSEVQAVACMELNQMSWDAQQVHTLMLCCAAWSSA